MRRLRVATAALLLLLGFLTLHPIRANDYPWHLATGRWMWDHGSIPEIDPFALASDPQQWINGEWLFDALLEPLYRAGGHEGVSIAIAAWVAAVFALAFVFAARRIGIWFALLLTAVCWFGALHRLDARPATAAIAFPPLAVLILESTWRPTHRLLLYALLTALWINIHPSALLAPAIAGLYLLPSAVNRRDFAVAAAFVGAGLTGLLVNPHGVDAVTAPLHLVGTIGTGTYVNTEWLPSHIGVFPLLYVVIAAGLALLIARPVWRRDAGGALVFLLFAVLALRGVRNQDLFFTLAPLLLSMKIGRMKPDLPGRLERLAAAGALAIFLSTALTREIGTGLDRTVFPVSAVEQLARSGLQGNVYNPDQLGGYLAWSFYPERRHLVDGRHELFDRYLAEYAAARVDGRLWRELIRNYGLTLAVDEYHRETMTVVDSSTGARRAAAASLIYFPRERWALIGFDGVAMVFARRDAHPSGVLAELEYRRLVPDDPASLRSLSPEEQAEAAKEIERARGVAGDLPVIRKMQEFVN